MILKTIRVSFSAVAIMLTLSTVAIADSLAINGSGGEYSYEIWQADDNSYYLKIWKRESYGEGDPLDVFKSFKFTGEALDYFDCHYGEKSSACSRR